ncbi:uncharacterized protein LOC129779880 [Toxorhynchites rutilus septentrionalis]|uniref:uncharacterized protein LOC129779880 n=1 Tax=Toxorhynchites rutilus septentrionalis TaxID=329112 RepID=UPI00247AAEAD|nr:uncharacterized protein LOC129779880 [Toxorhynchites rutilus septentrionalis]
MCPFRANTMSEIELFPVEVLCCIFDKLNGLERRPLHLVCRRWYRVLTSRHYLRKRILAVSPSTIGLVATRVRNAHRFPCARISDDNSEPKSDSRRGFFDMLFNYLYFGDWRKQLRELTLDQVQGDLLYELFDGKYEKMEFPNLKYLKISCYELCPSLGIQTWKMPVQLTKLEITVGMPVEMLLIEILAPQLEELLIESSKMRLLLMCCDVAVFEKLRILQLKSDTFFPERFADSREIGDKFVKTLNRLDKLAIEFRHNDFLLGYAPLLRHCHSLSSLSIFGADLCVEACNVIGQMQGLRQLELLMRIEKCDKLIPWNLPNLRSIHTFVESLIPLGEKLPSLKVIRVSNHTIREGRFSVTPMEQHYAERYVTYLGKLSKLTLYDVHVEEHFLLRFPMMQATELVLRCVRTSTLVLDVIYERIPKVASVYFLDCCFPVSPQAKISSFESLQSLLPHARISHSSSKILPVDHEQISS